MRILLAISTYHQGAGYPRYGSEVARGLAARGHDVTVLHRAGGPSAADAGIRFIRYRSIGPGKLLTMATEPLVLTRALRRLAPTHDVAVSVGIPCRHDVVLIGLGTHAGYARASWAATPVTSARGVLERVRPFHRVVMAWERAMLTGTPPRSVVVGAARFAPEYPDIYGYPADRVVVIPMGVDIDAFAPDDGRRARLRAELGVGDAVPVLASVANRARQKGLDVLVAALEGLHRRDPSRPWVAVFAGDGSDTAAMRSATARLRDDGRVRLLGRVPDIRAVYCAADLTVFPSRYDPWGLVVTESLACGTPVLVSPHAGASMAVEDGRNGAVLDDPSDPGALATAIAAALDRDVGLDRAAVRATVLPYTYAEGVARLDAHLQEAAVAARRTT